MHIVFFTHYFYPEGNAPASRTLENCRRWVEAGHRVTVITGVPNVPAGVIYEGYENKPWQEETIDGIRVVRVWTYVAPNKGVARRIANYVSYMTTALAAGLVIEAPDVLVSTSPQFFCGLAGMVVGRSRRVPRVLEIRDIWPESITAVGAMKRSPALRALEHVERFMYRSADRVVTVGPGYADKLVERGVPRGRIDVITNGADLGLFQPGEPDAALRARYELGDRFTAAYVGTIGMASGLDVALEVSRRLTAEGDDSIRLLLVGDGAERERLQRAAEAEGLRHVVFAGRLPKEQIPRVLRSVQACFIHLRDTPLFRTVLPSKLFEAFAVARPTILGVDGDARAILEQADAGVFVPPEDADATVAALRALQADPERCARYGANGLAQVQERYNRDVLAARYLDLLEQVARQR